VDERKLTVNIHQTRLKIMGNIDDREKFAEYLWDWEFLNPAFPGKIQPMDVDGVVEMNGNFLILEGKALSAGMSKGQEIALEAMSENPDMHVLMVYGDPKTSTPRKVQLLGYHDKPIPCGKEGIRRIAQNWVKHVKGF
jgi:hypothetical protein